MRPRRFRTRPGGVCFAVAALLVPALLVATTPRPAGAICNPGGVLVPGPIYPTGLHPRVALPLDLNGDGILDIALCTATAEPNDGYVQVFLGNGTAGMGDGTFTTSPGYTTGVWSLAMASGDFNNDGITDLAVTNHTGASVSILLGLGSGGVGDGTFAPAVTYPIGIHPFGIAVADFDEDGIQDLVIADNGDNYLRLLKGQGSGGVGTGTFVFQGSLPLPNLPLSVVVGDFDENGHVDIAATASYSGTVAVYLGNGDLTFDPFVAYPAGTEPYDLATDDLNADGITDLIVGESGYGGAAVLLGQGAGGVGDGSFAPPVFAGLGSLNVGSVVPGDFDGDGLRDVLAAHTVGGKLYLLRGNGDGTLKAPIQVGTGSFPLGIHAADFNEDGLLDLAVPNYNNATLAILNGFCSEVPNGPEPTLDDVRDVPNDQGGKVFVTWRRSSYDGVQSTAVTSYRVWRRIPPALAAAARPGRTIRTRLLPAGGNATMLTYWEAMATLPAQRLEGYGYTSATTQDSLPGSNPYTAFFVTALTADPNLFYDSAVDSGYSVDNLAPPAPGPFTGAFAPGEGYALHWSVSGAADFLEYRLYRGVDEGFVPDPASLISASPDTGYVDPDGFGQYFYKLAAVDLHQNTGPFLVLQPDRPTAALGTVVSVNLTSSFVSILWHTDFKDELVIEKREGAGAWFELGRDRADGSGYLAYEEAAPPPGSEVGYRLRDPVGGAAFGEIPIRVDARVFALAPVTPNPHRGSRMQVHFSLARGGFASLQLADAAGRVVAGEDRWFEAGGHDVDLSRGRTFAPGVYFLVLRQDDQVARRKVVVVH